MTTSTSERTPESLRAEIRALEAERVAAKGATKGVLTRKLKHLEVQLVEAQHEALDASTGTFDPVSQTITEPESMLHVTVDEANAEVAAMVEAAREVEQPHIVDSEKIDDIRYSIDVGGRVWAPVGDERCGRVIGLVSHELVPVVEGSGATVRQAPYWITESDDQMIGRSRSRRSALIDLVAAKEA